MNFRLFLKHLPDWLVEQFGVHDGRLQLSSDVITMMMITVFWNIAPCRLVIFYRPFGGVCCFHFRRVQEWFWTWRQKASSKLRYQITNQYNVITQKSVLFAIKLFVCHFVRFSFLVMSKACSHSLRIEASDGSTKRQCNERLILCYSDLLQIRVEHSVWSKQQHSFLFSPSLHPIRNVLFGSWTFVWVQKRESEQMQAMRRLRFSQRYCWRCKPSGMWRCVFKGVVTDVSKDLAAYMFGVKQSKKYCGRKDFVA
jgi:hypothetical protein